MLQGPKHESKKDTICVLHICVLHGWDKVDGKWSPIWYHGSSMPEKLNDWDSGEAEEGPGEDEEEEGLWSEDESADEE